MFTPQSGDVGGVRTGSGGCVAERARVPGRFVIATEAVVCRRWASCRVKRLPGPAIVAQCKEAATVNSCAQGGECRGARAKWPQQPADSMRAAALRPAPT
ncbi:unnamed protein product [Danaus chrysippus]|uniref:(African queen) hypothetical protein n=1 Tax=Danaus chrysippus TaxID=151541 RepID=A0A8J2QZU1_9NEOP|nr:unnamed protein product [Danaus chrysippus]